LARLREQSTFDSEQELVDQIARDVAQSREVFTSTAPQDMKLLG
jgi:FAD synthase